MHYGFILQQKNEIVQHQKVIIFAAATFLLLLNRRDARVVDWGGLENRCPGNWTVGSNPSLSATDCTGRTALKRFGFCFHGYAE